MNAFCIGRNGQTGLTAATLFVVVVLLLLASGARALEMQAISSTMSGCAARDATAQAWAATGSPTFTHTVPGWCVVAHIPSPGQWQAEQWRAVPKDSHGWRVRLPLATLLKKSSPDEAERFVPADGVEIIVSRRASAPPVPPQWPTHAAEAGRVEHIHGRHGPAVGITVPISSTEWAHVLFQHSHPRPAP